MRTGTHTFFQLRAKILVGVIVLTALVFVSRLFFLQVMEYDVYAPRSERNSLRNEIIPASRGLIYDRNGTVMVENVPIFTITITPANFDTSRFDLLARLTGLDEEEIRARHRDAIRYSWYRPSTLMSEIGFERFSIVEENIWQLPGVESQIEFKRNYPSKARASHVLGYLREAGREDIARNPDIRSGERVGKSGIELTYDEELRGESGARTVRVNALGQAIGRFERQELHLTSESGRSLTLTLDAELQALAETLMQGKIGAAIAMDPSTGELLAFVSNPQPDLARLAGRLDRSYWAQVNQDSLSPLFNRALSSQQPPGSTVKPIMGIIGQKMGLVDPDREIHNPGAYYRGRAYQDLAPPGDYDLRRAIRFSSNTYFLELMDRIASRDRLNEWAGLMRDFGLGVETGIDVPFETSGLVPDSLTMDRIFGRRKWGVGDVLNLGIGQGVFSVSPVQLTVATSIIANRGVRVQPHVVRAIGDSQRRSTPVPLRRDSLDWARPEYFGPVVEGMRGVVAEGNGRWLLDIPGLELAGKTGTAQNPTGTDHGWFTGFAPAETPAITVTVLIEQGGFGSLSAGPIASLLVEQYLTGTLKRDHVLRHVRQYRPPKPDDVRDDRTGEAP